MAKNDKLSTWWSGSNGGVSVSEKPSTEAVGEKNIPTNRFPRLNGREWLRRFTRNGWRPCKRGEGETVGRHQVLEKVIDGKKFRVPLRRGRDDIYPSTIRGALIRSGLPRDEIMKLIK